MRQGMSLAIAWLFFLAGALAAQERIPLPSPDPGPAGEAPLSPPAPVPQGPALPPPPPFGSGGLPLDPPYPPALYPPGASPYLAANPPDSPCFWIGLEALIWWEKNQPVGVPLVTTGPASQGASAGNLGAPGTTVLDGSLDYGATGGFRLYMGGWFDANHRFGMDGSLFVLGQETAGYSVNDRSGVGNFVINEPVAGAPFNTQVSTPGVQSGWVAVDARSRFGGGDINFLYNLYRGSGLVINLLAGWRLFALDESLDITANSNLFTTTNYTDNMGNVLVSAPPGSAVTVIDQFRTRNTFNGGQIGAQFQYFWRRWMIGGAAKLAVGGTHEVVYVNGSTNVFPVNADPVPLAGGNYASLQAGRYSQDKFALAPQAQLYVGYQITPCLRAQVGYDFLFLSNVLRPGNQIDNTFDGLTHPLVPMTTSTFWAQGATLSLQFNF